MPLPAKAEAKAELLRQALRPVPPPPGSEGVSGPLAAAARQSFARDLDANVDHFGRIVGYGESYDVILRRLRVAGVGVAVFCINGMFQDLMNLETMLQIARVDPHGPHAGMEGDRLGTGAPAEAPEGARGGSRPAALSLHFLRALLQDRLAYAQVTVTADFQEAVTDFLSGQMLVLVDGEPGGILVDTRYYPDRDPSAPDVERVLRGPDDGFIETLIFNTALVRRRVRDPGIRFALVRVGRRSKTDVAVTYIEGLTNPALVRRVQRELRRLDVDAIPDGAPPIAEHLGGHPWNPFPTARLTERPDVVATNLFDGHVAIIVDTTPVALIVPVSLLQLLQNPDDYQISPVFGTYMRWVEFVAVILAGLVPPLWVLLAIHPGLLAHLPGLAFIGPKQPPKIPLVLQFLLAEVSIDILRRAILNSPAAIATSFGILGAVVLGSVATKTGVFAPEALVYMVTASIASFAVSNIELGMTLRLIRLTLLVLVWLWSLAGLAAGLLFWLVLAARTESLGVPYLWPLVPFDWPALRSILVREPLVRLPPRPAVLTPRDRLRGSRA
jgi:stage V sporulation protein AF